MQQSFRTKKWFRVVVAAVVIIAAAAVAWALWPRTSQPRYIIAGNGRLEATEYDVATKLAGRLAELAPHEGDAVQSGQRVGRIAIEDVRADWSAARSQAQAADHASREARDSVRAAESSLVLARQNLARVEYMYKQRATTADVLDRNRSDLQTAEANLAAARARVAEANSKTAAAQSDAVSLGSRVSDAELKAPVTGPVLHRIVEPGAMLAVGGKVLTVLDLSDLWMNVYFPTDKVGKISVGDEAKIVLDALPDEQIPARVTFVSPKNQFTPREVETHNEREKLMFRVKVRVDQSWLANHGAQLKAGMPGVTYLRLDPTQPWPQRLRG